MVWDKEENKIYAFVEVDDGKKIKKKRKDYLRKADIKIFISTEVTLT